MYSLYARMTLSRKRLYLVAALMWTFVGCGLLIRGAVFLASTSCYFLFIMVLLLGIIKFFLGFRNVARKNVIRLGRLERDVFICAVFPLRIWILIVVMIILGTVLRFSPLPGEIYNMVIAGVGLAMLIASAIFWKAWAREAARVNS